MKNITKTLITTSSLLLGSAANAAPILPSFDNSKNYIGIHLGTKNSGPNKSHQ